MRVYAMFFEAKIYDRNGNIKKIVGRDELKKVFWARVDQEEKNKRFNHGQEQGLSPRLKKKLQAVFPELYYLSG